MINYVWAVVNQDSESNVPDIYSSRKKAEPVYNEILEQIRANGWKIKEVTNKYGRWATVYDLDDEEITNLSLERISVK